MIYTECDILNKISVTLSIEIIKDFIHKSGSATIEEVLQAYLDQNGQWWWLLVAEKDGEHFVCSFGSLLPYLSGRTPHIENRIEDCAICSALDPISWTETDLLVDAVLEDSKIHQRVVSDLPMVELPIVDDPNEDFDIVNTMMMQKASACGVRTNGVMSGVFLFQMKGNLGELPQK